MGDFSNENLDEAAAKILNTVLPVIRDLVDDVSKIQATQTELEILENKFGFLASQMVELKTDTKKQIEDLYIKSSKAVRRDDHNKEIDRILVQINELFVKSATKLNREDLEKELQHLATSLNEVRLNCQKRSESLSKLKKELYVQLGKAVIVYSICLTALVELIMFFAKNVLGG